MEDLVSYNDKHNEANGENNQDGANDNNSWNMGIEGPTDNPEIIAARERQKRNFLATLFLSQGVPMLCGGDEIAHTQRGNNNAYCQDNEISWYDWKLDDRKRKLLEFTRNLINFRKLHPNLRRRKFFQDRDVYHPSSRDIAWYRTDGQEMTQEQWNTGWQRSLAVMLNGRTLAEADEMGEPIVDDTFLVMLNSYGEGVTYTLPQSPRNHGWKLVMNTNNLDDPFAGTLLDGKLDVAGRSVVILRELSDAEVKQPGSQQAEEQTPAEPEAAAVEPKPEETAVPEEQKIEEEVLAPEEPVTVEK